MVDCPYGILVSIISRNINNVIKEDLEKEVCIYVNITGLRSTANHLHERRAIVIILLNVVILFINCYLAASEADVPTVTSTRTTSRSNIMAKQTTCQIHKSN
jgi:hypothetical protein